MDNAICGGAGSTLTGNALKAVKAAIFMGDPHNRNGLPYNVGTCKAQGVSPLLLQLLVSLLTSTLVRRPPCWIHLRTCQQQHHPELLRLSGSILLQRKRRQPPPAVRQHLRQPGSHLHQEQGHCLSASLARTGENKSWPAPIAGAILRCKYESNEHVYALKF